MKVLAQIVVGILTIYGMALFNHTWDTFIYVQYGFSRPWWDVPTYILGLVTVVISGFLAIIAIEGKNERG